MAIDVYLAACLKDGRSVRWPDSAMPIRVYTAPFRWYEESKQRQAGVYEQLVLEAMAAWREASGGRVQFRPVTSLRESQIDVRWRRVDRQSLGHCEYLVKDGRLLYSAEISIGISDGLIHAAYNALGEVRHTMLHEFGHALGLIGHSDQPGDIMYVPHQYGVESLSARDATSIHQLYRLPPGFDPAHAAARFALPPSDSPAALMNAVLTTMQALSDPTSDPAPVSAPPVAPPMDDPDALDRHHRILSAQGRFHLATQHIQLDPAQRHRFRRPPPDGRP